MFYDYMIKDLRKLYATFWQKESVRLKKDAYHSLEFITTRRFLKKYLPKKGFILDAGGGTGIYTIWLAKQGYNAVLLDLSKHNIEAAKKDIEHAQVIDRIKKVMVGDITSMPYFDDSTFDVVLCLGGPVSLIYGKEKRKKAMTELVRVAKPDALIFVSVINKYGVLSLAPSEWPEDISTGNFISIATKGEDRMWMGKYYGHYFSPSEFVNEFKHANRNVEILDLAGLEGLGTASIEEINRLSNNKKAWKNWLAMHYMLCTDPEVVGMSAHVLLVARKLRD
jgi:2-polyprenyl-3-methyl-5-hydroxy-6-metoxy-1,4-benzoquinol methylase